MLHGFLGCDTTVGDHYEDEGCHSEPERSGSEESYDGGNCKLDSSAYGLRMTGVKISVVSYGD